MVLIEGENGQGKSNLLEAIYILAIAKSPRASADRELLRRPWTLLDAHSQVSALVQRDAEPLRVQIDIKPTPAYMESQADPASDLEREPEGIPIQKYIRVNGVPRRASELLGQVKAVMFTAHDLEMVYGPPSTRRRYLDILISQIDPRYLKSLQRYHRITYQRNHLLRMVREGRSGTDELGFWDDQLIAEGALIMARRLETVAGLSALVGPIYHELSGQSEHLEIRYHPSVAVDDEKSEGKLAQAFRRAIEEHRQREIAQGVTLAGPHRDDVQLSLNGMEAGAYASRGQSRTLVVAMKLAEARYLTEDQQEPILLLDDVLSELDARRRRYVLEWASRYQQCLITTTDMGAVEPRFLSTMSRFIVREGRLEPVGPSAP